MQLAAAHRQPGERLRGLGGLHENPARRGRRQVGSHGHQQRGCSGDVGRGHGSSAVEAIAAAELSAEDEHPGRRQVHAHLPEAGEGGAAIVVIAAGHRHDIVVGEGSRVDRKQLQVETSVPGGGHHQHVRILGGLHRILQGLGGRRHPGVVDDARADGDGVPERVNGVCDVAEPVSIQGA